LYFFPLPHQQRSLRPNRVSALRMGVVNFLIFTELFSDLGDKLFEVRSEDLGEPSLGQGCVAYGSGKAICV